MHVYEVSAIGLTGEIVRPVSLRIENQAASVLPYIGGYQTSHAENIRFNASVFAKSARSGVGTSHDEKHGSDTAFALAVIEGLNICDMVTADRVVARMSAARGVQDWESRFSVIGTQFENLRIAGCPVEARLDIDAFHELSTFSQLTASYASGKLHEFLHGGELPSDNELDRIYDLPSPRKAGGPGDRWYSLANHIRVEAEGLRSFGSIIIVPEFGVVHLAELFVAQSQRRLSMLRVQMGSPIEGTVVAATCSVGDTTDSTGPR